jgi:hypothetical protein
LQLKRQEFRLGWRSSSSVHFFSFFCLQHQQYVLESTFTFEERLDGMDSLVNHHPDVATNTTNDDDSDDPTGGSSIFLTRPFDP